MPINPDAVGATSSPYHVSWTSKDCLLYAVGIGAGTEELAFTTENTANTPQQVYPTFPVTVGWGQGDAMAHIGDFNMAMLLHGKQSVTLHQPLTPDGEADCVQKIVAIYDKGNAAVVVAETAATDANGKPWYTLSSQAFIRGEGGWGGDRGPSGEVNVPPSREPDHVVTYQTTKDQALLYRLTGDRNPLHSDPAFAAMGGFPQPILHGLCTYGFTGRALTATVCGGDSSRFKHMEARFKSPTIPGEALTIRIWVDGGDAIYTTSVDDRLVIDQGLCKFV
ncbi:MAG: MaoC/PaaZ C-terminal domain-containing protein [Acidimicrobiia bacterium]